MYIHIHLQAEGESERLNDVLVGGAMHAVSAHRCQL